MTAKFTDTDAVEVTDAAGEVTVRFYRMKNDRVWYPTTLIDHVQERNTSLPASLDPSQEALEVIRAEEARRRRTC